MTKLTCPICGDGLYPYGAVHYDDVYGWYDPAESRGKVTYVCDNLLDHVYEIELTKEQSKRHLEITWAEMLSDVLKEDMEKQQYLAYEKESIRISLWKENVERRSNIIKDIREARRRLIKKKRHERQVKFYNDYGRWVYDPIFPKPMKIHSFTNAPINTPLIVDQI